jgi:F-type H+-transporting ATPase subunit a
LLERVFEKMGRLTAFSFTFLGREIAVPNTLFVSWLVMAAIVSLAFLATRKLSVSRPGKLQCAAELLVETVAGLCRGSIGHHGQAFVPYLGTLLLFLAFANICSIFNFIPGLHIYPPTKDINVAGALALVSILAVLYAGLRYKGFRGWAKSLAQPMPLMAPFKILEYATKPLSLCLRLFGNVVAAFVIMELLLSFLPLAAAPVSIYFDLFDGFLQAFIFVYLTSLYIGEAVE